MDLKDLSRQIDQMQSRRGAWGDPAGPAGPPPDEAVLALDVTLEELCAAGDELHRMTDRLASAQHAGEAERRRYRALFDLAPIGYVVTDPNGSVVEANRAAAALLNIRPHHLVRKPLALFVAEDERAAFRATLAGLGRADRLDEVPVRLCPRHKPPIHATLAATVARDLDGNPTAVLWAMQDVSGRVESDRLIRELNADLERLARERTAQLREQIQAQEDLLIAAHADADADADADARALRDLIEGLDAIIWRADAATGGFTFVSRRAEELLGYPADRWVAEPGFWTSLLHPDDRDWAVQNRRRAVADGRDHESEYRLIADGGRHVWFREAVRVHRDPDGRPSELRGVMVNITRRKKVERQLHAAKQSLADELADLRYLHDLITGLSPAAPLEPLADEILRSAASLLGGELGALFLREPAGPDWCLAAGWELPDAFARLIARVPARSPWRGRVLAVDEPIAVADIYDLAGHGFHLPTIEAGGFRSVFSIPLFARDGSLLGCLAILFREPHRPPERQAQMVFHYVGKAAEFLENALLRHDATEADAARN